MIRKLVLRLNTWLNPQQEAHAPIGKHNFASNTPRYHPNIQESRNMSLEKDISRIADALEALVAAAKGGTTGKPVAAVDPVKQTSPAAPAAPTPPAAVATAAAVTQADAQLALQTLASKKGRDAAVALLAEHEGATKVANLKPEHYASFVSKANAQAAA